MNLTATSAGFIGLGNTQNNSLVANVILFIGD